MIKKMITAAALIAAGTALASADTSDWTSLQLSATSIDSGRSTLSDLGVTQDYNYAEYNWIVSFTVDVSNTNSGMQLFTTKNYTDQNGTCLGIRINTTSGLLNIVNNETDGHISTPDSTAGSDYIAFTPVSEDGYQYIDISIEWNASSSTMTLTSTQTDGLSFSATADLSETGNYHNLISYATLSTDSTLWTHSGDNTDTDTYTMKISNISVQVQQVPEPSMFGVLAGLGALGLVATRRRRNRKA